MLSILYILRGFKKLVIAFFLVKNIPKLINQQFKNGVKIVNQKKKIHMFIAFFESLTININISNYLNTAKKMGH